MIRMTVMMMKTMVIRITVMMVMTMMPTVFV